MLRDFNKATFCAYLQSSSKLLTMGASSEVLALPLLMVAETEQSAMLEFNGAYVFVYETKPKIRNPQRMVGIIISILLWLSKIKVK